MTKLSPFTNVLNDSSVECCPGVLHVLEEEVLNIDTQEPIGRICTFTLDTPTKPQLYVSFQYDAAAEPRFNWGVAERGEYYSPKGRIRHVPSDPLGQHKDEEEQENG